MTEANSGPFSPIREMSSERRSEKIGGRSAHNAPNPPSSNRQPSRPSERSPASAGERSTEAMIACVWGEFPGAQMVKPEKGTLSESVGSSAANGDSSRGS